MKFALILLLGITRLSPCVHAAETEARDSVNPKLTAKAEALIKAAMKVIVEDEGVVSMTFPGHSYAPKTQMLFFRRRGTRIEMIATGVFTGERIDAKTGQKELVSELDRDNIIKYPQKGDYAVSMTDPNLAALDAKDSGNFPAPNDTDLGEKDELPGYLEYGMGIFNGSIKNSPSEATVNEAKVSSGYRFINSHFAYYSHYVPFGFELDSYKGNFPTKTRGAKIVNSSESFSQITFAYRLKPMMNKHLALSARASSITDTFTTNNDDASLLTTKTTGFGFGTRAQWQFVSPAWKQESGQFLIQLQSIYADFLYFPSITATDTGISRGLSDGSTGIQYRIGAIGLAWIDFIPIFKRWMIQASYGAKAYNLKFSGTPVSESGNPDTIDPNGTARETESDYRFFVGIRFDDPVKFLFGNEDKKEK